MRNLAVLLLCLVGLDTLAVPGQIWYVKPVVSEIKQSPSREAKAALVVAIGRRLVEFGRRGAWMHVGIDKSGGHDGWIPTKNVSPTDPDGLTYSTNCR